MYKYLLLISMLCVPVSSRADEEFELPEYTDSSTVSCASYFIRKGDTVDFYTSDGDLVQSVDSYNQSLPFFEKMLRKRDPEAPKPRPTKVRLFEIFGREGVYFDLLDKSGNTLVSRTRTSLRRDGDIDIPPFIHEQFDFTKELENSLEKKLVDHEEYERWMENARRIADTHVP